MDKIKEWFKTSGKRYWIFFLILIALPIFDKSVLGVYMMLATIAVIIYVSNLIRQELFPYIHLKQLIDKTDESPVGSAIVVAAVIYLIAVTIQACVISLK